MSRFLSGGDGPAPFSDIHPERFSDPQAYEPPSPDRIRAIDDAPEPDPFRKSNFQTVRYPHLKGR